MYPPASLPLIGSDPLSGGDLWAALEEVVERVVGATLTPARQRELVGEFMAMGPTHDGERARMLWGYKHVGTRRYVFLDHAGGAYHYDAGAGRYVGLPARDAIARAREAS